MHRSLLAFFGHLRIRTKIMISFVLILLACVSIFGYFSYREIYSASTELAEKSLRQDAEVKAAELRFLMDSAEIQAMVLANNGAVRKILYDRQPERLVDEVQDYWDLSHQIELAAQSSRSIVRMYRDSDRHLFADGSRLFASFRSLPYALRDVPSSAAYRWIGPYVAVGSTGEEAVLISFALPLRDTARDQSVRAVASFSLEERTLREILSRSSTFDSSVFICLNGEGEIIAATASDPALPGGDGLRSLLSADSGGTMLRGRGADAWMYVSSHFGRGGFTLVAGIPLAEFRSRSREILTKIVLGAVAVLMLCIAIAAVVSGGLTRRIRSLAETMHTFSEDRFGLQLEVVHDDEISDLKRAFNFMSSRLATLVREVYQGEIRNKHARLELLKAQINPHFLYNTLDYIGKQALDRHHGDLAYVLSELADFLRLSLNGGNERSTVMNEIRHIKAYSNILRCRFGDRVVLDIRVPLYLYPHDCLNLILQPLVENAYTHGIAPKSGGRGTITIDGTLENGEIALSVADDGVGCEEGAGNEGHSRRRSELGGYGLFNVRQRLAFAYEGSGSLSMAPGINGGTVVTIRFPAESELKSDD